MTPSETLTLVRSLIAAFPRQEITRETLQVYCHMLADLDAKQAEAAVGKIIAAATFFPSIAEIRAAAVESQTTAPSAEDAWTEVRKAISSQGRNRSPVWSHPAIERAVDCIGWQTLCGSENIGIERAHFLKIYASIIETERMDLQLGIHKPSKRVAEIQATVLQLADHMVRKDEGGAE